MITAPVREQPRTLHELGWQILVDHALNQFSPITEIYSIYLELVGESLLFWVLSDEKHENHREVLGRIVDALGEVMDLYPNIYFDMRAIPMILCPEAECVPRGAKLIYRSRHGRFS